jgi:uncharacterized protein YbjT (DUF2867 family)
MRVLITGGTGLIGRALTDDLANDSHEVILLSRSPERAKALPEGVRAEHWDGHTASGRGSLASGADAVPEFTQVRPLLRRSREPPRSLGSLFRRAVLATMGPEVTKW